MAISDFRGTGIKSRGIRNNNAGNVRPLSVGVWLGQVGVDDKNFVIFGNMAYGIRAWLQNFQSSVKKHNTTTLASYINRYAPPSENKTQSYIDSMSKATGIDPNAEMPMDRESIAKIMRAQFDIELGKEYADYITDEDIAEGFNLLDSPLQAFFGAAKGYAQAYPVATYGAASLLLISTALISWVGYRMVKRKK